MTFVPTDPFRGDLAAGYDVEIRHADSFVRIRAVPPSRTGRRSPRDYR
ncbi:hypothetical protein ABZS66_09490 [Dactylosporangium sp. NPDC005572]